MRQTTAWVAALGLGMGFSVATVSAGEPPEDRGLGRNNVNSFYSLSPTNGSGTGSVQLHSNPARDAIFVRVSDLDLEATYDVVLSRDGDSESIGMITTLPGGDDGDGAGSGQLKLSTKRGDSLPLGASGVRDLAGATVDVNDGSGSTVLSGAIAEVPAPRRGRRPEDGNGGGGQVIEQESLMAGPHDASFRRGDANMDGSVNLGDAIRVLSTLYQSHPAPYCLDAMDANDDGSINVADPVSILSFLFVTGGDLPAPGAAGGRPGFDRTADGLFCDELRTEGL